MIVKLPFAGETVAVDLRGMRVRPVAPSAPPARRDLGRLVGDAIDNPIAGAPLQELARNAQSATIIVPDATRKVDLPEILPFLFERLQAGGIDGSALSILVACGTHPAVPADHLRDFVGVLPPGATVVQHECRDTGVLVEVGELRPGIPLRLHREAVQTDLLITLGTVRHHYFAGFGGGPKMVFPGVAGHREIQENHALVLSRQDNGIPVRHPGCEPGLLQGNPVAEEIARAADAHPPGFAVCLVEGRNGGAAWAVGGPWRPAFEAAVERTRSWFETSPGSEFDVMIASGGGTPTDSTLIQAHKGLDAACRFLAPGGRLLYVASLDQGAGSAAMHPFLDDPRPGAILSSLNNEWVQYGHTTLRLVEKTARYRVALYSRLEPTLSRRLGFAPVTTVEEVVDAWRHEQPALTVGVMASGAVFPRS